MAEKRKKIYKALVDGATDGLSDKALYDFVVERCPKTSSKKIVRAALFALTDPDVTDRHVLNTIYALAIKHRMSEIANGDTGDDQDAEVEVAPSRKSTKRRPARSTAPPVAVVSGSEGR
ncbi:hypothetical protein GFL38_14020 [Rhizobium leguminosarum bv. viciae]|uniref:hypothetical protein n=1 Tax=Rhizobium ruizarguesonis TaxID=2081791 RepID=UPI00143FA31A|nr:hypothetical protein [Rhizobium ruizarguesonis]NKJ73368.1 hypothetical protein [Rhizobium leguminosarum bv. viciae]NKQ70957.1 hypothetical protein [Rhizobium ruizarguesonis]NKQ78676.1 hypothetical protein [Rhizobium ruizarguesonis]